MNWTIVRPVPRGVAAVATLAVAAVAVAGSTANEGCIYDAALLASGSPGLCPDSYNAGQSPTIPQRPAASDPSALELTVVVAMQSIDVGVGVAADGGLTTKDGGLIPDTAPQPHIGYNLDGVCTCCGAAPSCIQPVDSGENCDDDAGRDNTGIKLFRSLQKTGQVGNEDVNQAMYDGLYGIVIEITGYNGQPNDREVTVNIYASNGIVLAGDAGPHHDGTDKWTLDPRYLDNAPPVGTDCENNGDCIPLYTDPIAYVTCGVLVAHPPIAVPFTFGGRASFGGAVMKLQQPYIVGNLVQTTVVGNLGWAITNGSVSGRWESSDLLSNMATIPDPTTDGGTFLCGTDGLYAGLKPFICNLQDIMSNQAGDNNNLTCDSISMAFGFTAAQALLGVVAPIPPTPAGCTGSNGMPFSDTCL